MNETPSALALSVSTFAENAAGATVGTISATDPDSGETFTYSISGTDKDSFELSGTTLKLKDTVSADFESDASYSITLTASDSGSNTVSKDYTISVTDVNETPSALALSVSTFAENAAGATVGTISATDPDSGETFTYSISGTDKDSFELSGTTLKLKDTVSADFESDASYSITITATDSADNTVSKDYTISVTDVNEVSTLVLSNTSISENTGGGTVGSITITDPDIGDTNTLTLLGTDKDSFELSGTTLKLKDSVSANFESDASYSITITATDSADNTVSKDYTISVTDVNETPSALALSVSTFAENAAGATVGTISATDPDSGETFTYSISGTDKDSFELSGTTLKLKDTVSADFESDASYSITITATDSADNTVSKDYTISVTDVNEVSTLVLSNTSISENTGGGTVGSITITDPDIGDTNTLTLLGTDKDSFELSGTTLKLKDSVSANFESDASYSITITATDSADNTVSKDYTITVTDVNETPSAVALSASSFAENAAGATIGTLSATDPDSGETFTYSISGTDKDSFELSGTTLKLKDTVSANFESDASYSITITASDPADNTVSKDFSISVTDENESPSITSTSTSSVSENTSAVITLTGTDPESDTLAYSISGGDDASLFTINSTSGALSFSTAPDYETPTDSDKNNTYNIQVTATDPDGLTNNQTVSVAVTDVNETISGKLIDGYIGGATVFQDLDNDGVLDAGEPYTTTDSTGAFSLTLQSASSDTPVRVINSGFDTATNDVLTASLDISATSSGSYILTPLSTLSARMLSFDSDLYKDTAEQIVADAFGITLSDAPSTSLFGYDPIATMIGSDASLATKAQPVYTANQLLMTLGHLTSALGEHMGPTALASVQTAIQTVLDNASKSATASLTWGDKTTLKSEAHEAFMNALAEHLVQHKPSIDGFRMEEGSITLTDYLSSDADSTNVHQLYTSHAGTTLTANLVAGTMDQTNLSNIVSSDSSSGKSPVLSFKLNSIPAAGESGTASITLKLYDGSDATQSSGERLLQTTVSVNWSSDGSTVSMTLPGQSLTIDYFTTDGTLLQRTYANADEDILTVNKGGLGYPTTLDLRVASFFSGKGQAEGVDLTGYITAGSYFFDVGFTGLDFLSSGDSKFTNVQGAFTVAASPGVAAYAEDVVVSEGAGTASVKVTLSKAAASDVTIDYQTANGTTTSSDFTSTSGTLTIAAGDTSGTISIPITNDTTAEAQENLTLNLSNASNATLGKSAVTISIVDNEAFLTNSTAVADVLSTTLESLQDYLTTTIKSFLNNNSLAVDGVSKTYATILSDYGSVTDLDVWIKTYTESMTSGATKSMTSFVTAIDTYVTSSSSGTPTATDLATALTKVNVGIKAIDFSQILGGTLISDSGTFANSVTQSSFDSSLSGKVTSVINLAADTIGDVLGTDTATNFPNATIKILTSGDDTANGTSGSDLIASLNGADTVNALAGNDKMIGGSGVDTFDGGEGNDYIYGYTGNDSLTGGAGNDKIVGGLGNDTLIGGVGNDTLWGQTGNDMITTGAGSDDADGGLGNDAITVDGTGNKTIDGGAGTDSLTISVSGISNLGGYTITTSGDYLVLTDANGNAIQYKNMESLTVGSYSYTEDTSNDTFWNSTEKVVYMYDGGNTSSGELSGFTSSPSSNFSLMGSGGDDYMNLNIDRSSELTGTMTVSMGDGSDTVGASRFKNGDSVDMGAGDDNVYLYVTNSSGTPALSALSMAKLDGGAGNDTLGFGSMGSQGSTELTLTAGGAVNFENITGSAGVDIIRGDNGNNALRGDDGDDTIYGGDGNDALAGWHMQNGTTAASFNDGDMKSNSTDSSRNSNDSLYGGAGNDLLVGTYGNNTLDGGTGADTIYSGSGSDTIVLRVGDGGSTITDADTITDFTDGSDFLGLGGSLTYSDLTIAQGTGSNSGDTIIKAGSEYLAILTGITASNVNYFDVASMATGNQTLSGTSGDDVLIGAAGIDTVTSNTGTDVILTHKGDDAVTIDGVGNKTIDGGIGTDSLTISVSGISNLGGYTITTSGDYLVLTDANGNAIQYKNMESLTVGSYSYTEDTSNDTFWNSTEKVVYMYDGGNTSSGELSGFTSSPSSNFSLMGSGGDDYMNLNIDRSSELTGTMTVSMGDGSDTVGASRFKNGDSVDMGAGDDNVYLYVTNSSGTPALSALSMAKLDGGAGNDTLGFGSMGSQGSTELTLTAGGAVNFENITGSAGVDIIRGDNGNNALRGDDGDDTIYGGDGNDALAGWHMQNGTTAASFNDGDMKSNSTDSSRNSNDSLYGGAGNDLLVGTYGNNTLDGGTGADTIYSGSGSDTIVLRVGDGGSTITDADTITDFTDGSDFLGLGGSLTYSDLTIAQGTGSNSGDTIIKAGSEYLAILTGITASNVNYFDVASMATGNQTLSGTSGDDVLIGAAGIDTVTSNTGTDVILTHKGDDAVTIDGVGNKTIDGGIGTDSLTISVSGISNLGGYTITTSGDYLVLTDANGNAIQYKNMESLTVGSYSYTEDTSNDTFWNSTEKVVYMYDGGNTSSGELSGFTSSPSSNFSLMGSGGDDYMNLNIDRSSELTGTMTVSMGDGSDTVGASRFKNGDSVDMGAGDDNVYLYVTNSSGTPALSALSMAKLDGGAGNDTLGFGSMGSQGSTELTLTAGGAVNFENITGSAGVDIIRGDNGNNALRGDDGDDTIYGGDGNDALAGWHMQNGTTAASFNDGDMKSNSTDSSRNSNDSLYGGAGNDLLVGTYGNNTLDGGTGADTIYSGSGSDTIVLRVGDGGSTITDADTITDFTDGTDLIGLDNGLAFGDLNIQQGTDSYSNHTIIKAGSEYLAVVENMTASNLTESSFTPVDINELLANNIYSGTLDDGTLDIDFSGIRELPPRDINVESEAMDSNQLPVIEENNKIELNLEEDLSEILLEVKDPEPVSATVDNDIGYFVGTAYEEDELLFAGLEI